MLYRWLFIALVFCCGLVAPSHAQDKLVFCNEPERIRAGGVYADTRLEANTTYTVFYHYLNTTTDSGDFAITMHSTDGKPFTLNIRQGLADPHGDPPVVGRQAMARFFQSGEKKVRAAKGSARFGYPLGARLVASGVLSIRTDRAVRMRIYYKHDKWAAPHMRTVVVDSPRCDVEIPLGDEATKHTYRIGLPELTQERSPLRDGSYGMIYSFKIAAPEGRRVRISFSPRGGKCGLVGLLGGNLLTTAVFPAFTHQKIAETSVGPAGYVTLTTSPYGGVFYPVEVTFQLL